MQFKNQVNLLREVFGYALLLNRTELNSHRVNLPAKSGCVPGALDLPEWARPGTLTGEIDPIGIVQNLEVPKSWFRQAKWGEIRHVLVI
jgi:hypothetical protein